MQWLVICSIWAAFSISEGEWFKYYNEQRPTRPGHENALGNASISGVSVQF